MTPKRVKPNTAKNKKKESVNRFYVGATHIAEAILDGENDEWTHPTLKTAIEHGKQLMEEEDRECITVVQIVRILRRKKEPIIVEKVSG